MSKDKPRVLVLGASAYYLRSIQALQKAGMWVAAVDRNPEAPGLVAADASAPVDITDAPGVLQAARDWGVHAVAPVNDFGVPIAAEVSQALGLRGLDPDAARRCVDKFAMRESWSRAGLPCPGFALAETRRDFSDAVDRLGLPCICKPTVSGGGSRGVMVMDRPQDVDRAYDFAAEHALTGRIIVEQFISGLEHSAEVAVRQGRARMLAISDKIKTPLPHRVDKDVIYPSLAQGGHLASLAGLAEKAALAVGINDGVAHVEMVSTDQGPFLYEIGARPGGGHTGEVILPYLCGINEFVLFVSILLGRDYQPTPPQGPRAAVYHFLTPRPGALASISGLDQVLARPEVLDAGVYLEPGQAIRPVRVGGDRAGFVVTGGAEREAALLAARQCEEQIVFDYN